MVWILSHKQVSKLKPLKKRNHSLHARTTAPSETFRSPSKLPSPLSVSSLAGWLPSCFSSITHVSSLTCICIYYCSTSLITTLVSGREGTNQTFISFAIMSAFEIQWRAFETWHPFSIFMPLTTYLMKYIERVHSTTWKSMDTSSLCHRLHGNINHQSSFALGKLATLGNFCATIKWEWSTKRCKKCSTSKIQAFRMSRCFPKVEASLSFRHLFTSVVHSK